MTPIQQKILDTALALKGIREIEPNQGWINAPAFSLDMRIICHWNLGDEWCADTAKVIWYNGNPVDHILYNRYFSANCVESWHNFRRSAEFKTSPDQPLPGSLVVWQLHIGGIPQPKGHMGIVTTILLPNFHSVEGNTSATGSRTGNIIWENLHTLGKPYNPNGLNVLGFVYVDKII